MDVEDVALRNNEFLKPAKKKTKKRASLLRASEQCSAVLLALRHIMDDIREDGQEVGRPVSALPLCSAVHLSPRRSGCDRPLFMLIAEASASPLSLPPRSAREGGRLFLIIA